MIAAEENILSGLPREERPRCARPKIFAVLRPRIRGHITELDAMNHFSVMGPADHLPRFHRCRSFGIHIAVLIDKRVCSCCPTSITPADNGVLAVYRDRSAEEVRDISYVHGAYAHGAGVRWTRPRPCHVDGWEIPG